MRAHVYIHKSIYLGREKERQRERERERERERRGTTYSNGLRRTDAMSTDAMSTDAMSTDAMRTDAMRTDAMRTNKHGHCYHVCFMLAGLLFV